MRPLLVILNAKIATIVTVALLGILSAIAGACYLVESELHHGLVQTNRDVQRSMHQAHDYRLP